MGRAVSESLEAASFQVNVGSPKEHIPGQPNPSFFMACTVCSPTRPSKGSLMTSLRTMQMKQDLKINLVKETKGADLKAHRNPE